MKFRKADMENKELNRSDSRSRRSHTNLANLRLAPLSTDFISNIPPASDTDTGYQTHHSSYIQGKSAPSTPGILGRSSSRRQLGAGLSQKLSWYDTATPNYSAVQVNREGIPLSTRSADTALNGLPKAQSDAALLTQRRTANSKLHTQLSHHSGAPRHHKRSQTGGRRDTKEEDWFTRAGLTTTSLLRESKGQSWLTSRHSSTSLHDGGSSDEDAETPSYLSASSHLRLHFADDELSPETPRYTSRWGSRFGSRAASARNSRRGSNADLALTPTIVVSRDEDGYFGAMAARNEEPVGPDFVDTDEGSDEEDAEEEIARLARERSSGFVGGLVDRLVGWSLFNVDEDGEGTDVEDEGDRDGGSRVGVKTISRAQPARNRQVLDPGLAVEEPQPERQDEGGWHDAAWLLSLASKVIL